MLDHVSISHASGLVLWSRTFNPTFKAILANSPQNNPVNALVKEVMIENKGQSLGGGGVPDGDHSRSHAADEETEELEMDGYKVKWTVENGLGLVFVVVFPALLPLTYVPPFLIRVKQLFLSLFQPYVQALVDALSGVTATRSSSALSSLQLQMGLEKWDKILDRCLRNFEAGAKTGPALYSGRSTGGRSSNSAGGLSRRAQLSAAAAAVASEAAASASSSDDGDDLQDKPLTAEEISKNVAAVKKSRSKSGKSSPSGSGRTSPSPGKRHNTRSNSAANKVMRKWGDLNTPVSDADLAELDFSTPAPDSGTDDSGMATPDVESLVSTSALGKVGKDGLYEVADWDSGRSGPATDDDVDLPTEDEILMRGRLAGLRISDSSPSDGAGEGAVKKTSALQKLFSRFSGSKVLTEEDLNPIMREMEKHLMSKNVAKEIAEKICENVGRALKGKKVGGFSSINSEVQAAMSETLTRILTSKSSTDILLDIKRKATRSANPLNPSEVEPYSITFVGVNGVGKSTNLSKVCFWLLQNKMRVLIAACDTFRSGAVEQLRVHVRNLGLLDQQQNGGMLSDQRNIELFERGYGKDAAGIAKEAIAYAKENRFDVVLIDTAGRMQDNEPLMRALAKLVAVNDPDKIIFVGEALVGNEAVDQLSKFDKSLKDFTSSGQYGAAGGRDKGGLAKAKARGIDGMILTKFDTIDDKVGAALSMTYITGQPIFFVGCGQTYTDLRALRVNHIVQALLAP